MDDGIRLASDALEVVVLPELGARLHRLRAFGHDVLRTPGEVETHRRDPFMWGGYVMAPWCNRIEASAVDVAGRRAELVSNFPDGTAIHGQVFLRSWRVAEVTPSAATFTIRGGGDGWPWRYEVRQHIAIEGDTLRIALHLANLDTDPMPGGVGHHPWFAGGPEVAIRGAAVFSPNGGTPAQASPVSGSLDLRRLGPMAEGVDATWTDLAEPPVELRWREPGIRARMDAQAERVYIVAANPPGAGAIAVEPETHAPQGLRRLLRGEPGPLAMIEPGGSLDLVFGLAFDRQ